MLDSTRRILAEVAGMDKTAKVKTVFDFASRHKKGLGAGGGALAAAGGAYYLRPETFTNLITQIRRYNKISDKIDEAMTDDDPGLKGI